MSISIVQAARASAPYPWAKFARWMTQQGLSSEELEAMLANGAEPSTTLINCELEDAPYPGLPSLEGLTLDPEPQITAIGGRP